MNAQAKVEIESRDMDTGFRWNVRYLTGHNLIDNTHQEFVARVHDLLACKSADLPTALANFLQHATAHFGQEDAWMLESEFPATDCHIEEHQKVIASVHEVQEQLATGNTQIVRDFAVALQDWFPAHTDYMDSALATWLVRRTHGGAPVVFRR